MNCWPSGKYVHLLYMYSILGRGSFCFNYCLNSAWHGGDQFVALLRWYGSPGFFDRRVCWPIMHSNTMVIEPAFGTFGSVGRCQFLLENEISISIKLVKFPGRWLRWLWTSENTVDQHQQMTWQPKSSLTVETSHWTLSNMDSTLLPDSGTLISKWNAKFTFIWKEDFGPLSYFSPQPR